MRGLQTGDLFKAMRVVKAAGVSQEIKRIGLLVQNNKEMNVQEIGFELIFTVLENLSGTKAEEEVYNLLGSIMEREPQELRTMDLFAMIEELKGLKDYIDMEQLKGFLSSLSKLMK